MLSVGFNLILAGFILYQYQTKNAPQTCCNQYAGSTMTIGAKDALKMIRAYRNERQQIINYAANNAPAIPEINLSSYRRNSNDAFIDSRAITFPIDTIKKYICSIERQIESTPSLQEYTLSGLRFYYIVYDESSEYVQKEIIPHKPDYENCHSLLIVPTVYDEERATHIDFEPNLFASKRRIDQGLLEENTPLQFLHLKTDASTRAALRVQNKGSICPPPKPCDGYDLLNLADDLCLSPELSSTCPD